MVIKLLWVRISNYLYFLLFLLFPIFALGQACPSQVSISANPGTTICAGTSVTFNANASGGTGTLSYQWYVGTVPSGSSSTFTTTSLINNDKVKVVVTDAGGTTCNITSNILIMTMNPQRTGSVTIQASNSNICPGENVNFSIGSVSNAGGGATYTWKVNGSPVGTNSTSYSSNILSNNDKVTLTVQSSVPCTPDFTSNEITIAEKPGPPNTPGTISGTADICPGTSQTYSISALANATSYNWSVPSGWTINSGQNSNSITVTAGTVGQNGNISISASDDCGTSADKTLAVTVKNGTPNTPGTISGTADICPGTSQTYSISAVANATSYNWSVPSGWTINSGQNSNSITVTAGTVGQNGNISISASDDCGTSADKTLAVTVKNGTPNTPGTISGTADICPGTSQTYSISPVANATSYNWSVPSGWTINSGQNSNSITVTAGTAGQNGNISVNASDDCGTSADNTLAVTVKNGTPNTPGTISGTADICPGTSQTYSISPVANATSYNWSVPSGWTINSGQNSTSITVTAGTAGKNGNISVNASDDCGISADKTLAVTVKKGTPNTPGTITGSAVVCSTATGLTYSISAVPNATSYNWTVPSGWTIQSGTGTKTITINAASASGNIIVTAQNDCGTSTAQSLAITTTNGVPAQPSTITASKYTVCPPETGFTLSVPQTSDADGYQWFLPEGWEITNGTGTNAITVKINASSNYSNPAIVGVEAKNICGNSVRRNTSSIINDSNAIAVSDFVYVNLGEDRLLCNSNTPVTIDARFNFGGKKIKVSSIKSSSGTNLSTPPGNVDSYTFTYTPTNTDLANGSVTITMITANPGGACQAGKDEIVLNFRPIPTASISAGPTICAGSSTNLILTGTPNTTVTYKKGSGANQTVNLGSGGSATINTGNLNTTTPFQLVSTIYNDTPTCQATLNSNSTVTVTPIPTAAISYSGTPFCTSDSSVKSISLTGTGAYQNGTYTASPAGLTIDSTSGSITPGTSTAGTYTVKYIVPASGGCGTVEVTTQVTITKLPTSNISYNGTPFCQSVSSSQAVTLNGTDAYTGGTFTSTSGLTIDANTGAITPSSSTPGTYTVTYTTPAGNGCGTTTSNTNVVITETPTPQIAYSATEFCTSESSPQNVTLSGGGNISNGTYSAPNGLTIVSTTGAITPSSSTPGTYTVTYTLAPSEGCGEITATADVTITQEPSVEISYNGPYCTTDSNLKEVNYTNGIGAYENGTFTSSPAGLNISADGKINPSASTAGTYTITYTILASGGCGTKDVNTTLDISEAPKATISYADSPFCNSDSNPKGVSFSQTAGAYENGTFSSSAGLIIDANTGEITPSSSTPGTYTVTYTIPAGAGCNEISVTTDVQVYDAPQITTQPYNVAVCTANSVTLEVAASGDNLTYQWYKGSGTGTPISGATNSTLTINNATITDDATYYVEVSGEVSCYSVKSDEVTLNVDENIVVNTQPVSQDLCEDGTLNLNIDATATDGNPQYQWRKNGNPLSDGGNISGATTTNLSIITLTSTDAGDYDVIIDGPDGYTCDVGYSQKATITVSPPPTAVAGIDFQACSTNTAISLKGTDASVSNYTSLEWTTSTGAGTISNSTDLNATYQPDASDYNKDIEFTLTAIFEINGSKPCSAAISTKNITILALPEITSFSYSGTEFCETDPQTQSPTVNGKYFTPGDGSYSVNPGTGLNLGTTTGVITPNGSTPGDYTITYTAHSNGVCSEEVTATFDITIGKKPVADFSYADSPYCSNASNPSPTLASGAVAGVFSSTTGLVFKNTSIGEIDIAASTPGTYTVTNTIASNGGCAEVSAASPITITKLPVATFSYADSPYCSGGSNPTVSLASGAEAGTFGSTTGLVFADASTGEINIASSTPGTYTVTNTIGAANGCEDVTSTAEVTITKLPDASFSYSDPAFCQTAGTNPLPNITGDIGGVFTGSNGLVINSTTGEINLSASTANNPNDDTDVYTVTYTFAEAGGCNEITSSFDVRIDSPPVGGELNFAGLNRATYLVCHDATSGSSRAIELSNYYGKVIKWQKTDTPSNPTSWTDIANTEPSYSGYSGLTKTTLFRAVLSSGSCGITYSKYAVISVIPANIKPDPVQASLSEICIGTAVQLASQVNYSTNTEIADGGDFNNANPKGWLVDGCGNCLPANGDATKPGPWAETNGPKTFNGTTYDTNDNTKFAIVRGNVNSIMQTPVFNTLGLSTTTLKFNQAYVLTAGAQAIIELSLDGGANYNVTLSSISGAANSGNYIGLNPNTIDLQSYVGQTNLRIRFRYIGTTGSSWALDNIAIPDRPLNIASVWSYTNAQGQIITVNNQQNITVTPDKIGLNTFKITSFLKTDDGTECRSADPNNSETVSVYVFDKYTSTATASVGTCGQNEFSLNAVLSAQNQGTNLTFPTPDGFSAPSWKVQGPAGWSFKNPDGTLPNALNNPKAIFVAPNEGTYVLSWAIERVNDGRSAASCPPQVTTVTVVVKNCTTLDFDGVDDFVDLGNYNGNYSIEAWIRPEASTGTIISTKNREINMSDLPAVVIPNTRWYHIAVDSGGKLYVDGIDAKKVITATGTDRSFIGAKWTAPNATNYFSGWIEEVRIWNGNISQDQIKFLMNQRLQTGTNIGVEIPMPSPGLGYDKLVGYYQLIADPAKIINGGYTLDISGFPENGKLRNMTTFQENTAPLPYTSATDNVWSNRNTWTQPVVWDFPNSIGFNNTPIDWNIVRTKNNITSGGKDIKVLGLLSDVANKKLFIETPGFTGKPEENPGQILEVTHYLKLDGIIDLVGESQLLQSEGSILEETSKGYLERDQQGTRSSYNYNYWTSIVSPQGGANNANYNIAGILMNGTDSNNPLPISFVGGPYGADNAAVNTSTYWLWRFHGLANDYASWIFLGSTGTLQTGEGFTMKGTSETAPISERQNYTFRGKPNNGTIQNLVLNTNENYLIGNPYPSAIDANEFLYDNLNPEQVNGARNSKNIFNGALYFWDHFAGSTHILREYIGGYAVYNLSGGVPAISNDQRTSNNNNLGTKTPKQYIPVGQGFFVITDLSETSGQVVPQGGIIVMKNSQRIGIKEGGTSTFLSPEKLKTKQELNSRAKIRLTFNSPAGYHRQLLVTADANTTNGFDLGYDAPMIENNVEDMFWIQANNMLVIQGVPNFDLDQKLPLGIKIKEPGEFSIQIDTIENKPRQDFKVYLLDKSNDSIYDLIESPFIATADAGTHKDRFSIIFFKEEPPVIGEEEVEELFDLSVRHGYNLRELQILNSHLIPISKVYLFDLNGKLLQVFEEIETEKEVRLKLKNYSAGVYVIKLMSSDKTITKKIIIPK